MINDSAADFWTIGLYVGFTTSLVSGDVRHPLSFEIYIALGSTHGPEFFFPQGFISCLRDRLVLVQELYMKTSKLHVHSMHALLCI